MLGFLGQRDNGRSRRRRRRSRILIEGGYPEEGIMIKIDEKSLCDFSASVDLLLLSNSRPNAILAVEAFYGSTTPTPALNQLSGDLRSRRQKRGGWSEEDAIVNK